MTKLKEIADQMKEVAKQHPFHQGPTNPIVPDILCRLIRVGDEVYDVIFSDNVFQVKPGTEFKFRLLSISIKDERQRSPSDETIAIFLRAFNVKHYTEQTDSLPGSIQCFQRQFVIFDPL